MLHNMYYTKYNNMCTQVPPLKWLGIQAVNLTNISSSNLKSTACDILCSFRFEHDIVEIWI